MEELKCVRGPLSGEVVGVAGEVVGGAEGLVGVAGGVVEVVGEAGGGLRKARVSELY